MGNTTAGKTRKSHRSRKQAKPEPGKPESQAGVGRGPSSTASAIPPSSPNPLTAALTLTKPGKDAPDPIVAQPQELEPKKQYWWRPADSKSRKLFEKIAVMDAAGHDDTAIAKRLKTTPQTIRQTRYIAKKNGWVDADGEVVDLEAELAFNIDRKIVRNIGAALDGQMTNYQTHEMTIHAAKGRGIFKNHEKTEATSAMPMVAIQVIMPPVGAGDQQVGGIEIAEDQIGGVPAYAEGEIVGEEHVALPAPGDGGGNAPGGAVGAVDGVPVSGRGAGGEDAANHE